MPAKDWSAGCSSTALHAGAIPVRPCGSHNICIVHFTGKNWRRAAGDPAVASSPASADTLGSGLASERMEAPGICQGSGCRSPPPTQHTSLARGPPPVQLIRFLRQGTAASVCLLFALKVWMQQGLAFEVCTLSATAAPLLQLRPGVVLAPLSLETTQKQKK